MKVIDFINRLNEIGFDKNTELTFSCVNGETGQWHELEPDCDEQDPFAYGEELTGNRYSKDVIDFCLNVDKCDEYLKEKKFANLQDFADELHNVINKYEIKRYA